LGKQIYFLLFIKLKANSIYYTSSLLFYKNRNTHLIHRSKCGKSGINQVPIGHQSGDQSGTNQAPISMSPNTVTNQAVC